MSERALSGLKVVELGDFISAPYCTKMMADLGAEVIKVEPPSLGDKSRQHGPFLNNEPHPEKSGLYLYLNTNKLGITLDVKTRTAQKILKRLLEDADVFVENNPPRQMAELGLDYESLKKVNPRLIVTSITPFGQTGHKASPTGLTSISCGMQDRCCLEDILEAGVRAIRSAKEIHVTANSPTI